MATRSCRPLPRPPKGGNARPAPLSSRRAAERVANRDEASSARVPGTTTRAGRSPSSRTSRTRWRPSKHVETEPPSYDRGWSRPNPLDEGSQPLIEPVTRAPRHPIVSESRSFVLFFLLAIGYAAGPSAAGSSPSTSRMVRKKAMPAWCSGPDDPDRLADRLGVRCRKAGRESAPRRDSNEGAMSAMHVRLKKCALGLAAASLLVLAACDGGSGGDPGPPDRNEARRQAREHGQRPPCAGTTADP